MKDQYITLEVAKKLIEAGFKEPVIVYWGDNYNDEDQETHILRPTVNSMGILDGTINDTKGDFPAPVWSQVIDWLYFKHGMNLCFAPASWGNDWFVSKSDNFDLDLLVTDEKDYFKAREKAILEALKLIKTP